MNYRKNFFFSSEMLTLRREPECIYGTKPEKGKRIFSRQAEISSFPFLWLGVFVKLGDKI